MLMEDKGKIRQYLSQSLKHSLTCQKGNFQRYKVYSLKQTWKSNLSMTISEQVSIASCDGYLKQMILNEYEAYLPSKPQ